MLKDIFAKPLAAGAIEQADPTVLTAAARPDVHLAIWWRSVPQALEWIAGLDWETIDDLDFVAPIGRIDDEIAEGLAEAGYPGNARGAALAAEIADLARRFADIFDLGAVKIRLEVIETDACRKFHADHVVARLLTTFAGQGTQWMHTGDGAEAPIHQMRPGDVGIFKGRLSVEEPAIMHRSPPIAGKAEHRLLLAIDPALAQPAGALAQGRP